MNFGVPFCFPLKAATRGVPTPKFLGVPVPFFPGILLSTKPPETQGKRAVFGKNDGLKAWKRNQPLKNAWVVSFLF